MEKGPIKAFMPEDGFWKPEVECMKRASSNVVVKGKPKMGFEVLTTLPDDCLYFYKKRAVPCQHNYFTTQNKTLCTWCGHVKEVKELVRNFPVRASEKVWDAHMVKLSELQREHYKIDKDSLITNVAHYVISEAFKKYGDAISSADIEVFKDSACPRMRRVGFYAHVFTTDDRECTIELNFYDKFYRPSRVNHQHFSFLAGKINSLIREIMRSKKWDIVEVDEKFLKILNPVG